MNDRMITVYLIEQLELVRRSIRTSLQPEQDIDVVGESASLEDAIDDPSLQRARVTVLASDVSRVPATDAVYRLRAGAPSTNVILMVGYPRGADVVHAVEAGVRACLTYAATMAELIESIRIVHAGQTTIDQEALTALFEHLGRMHDDADTPERRLERLTAQERRVLALLSQGASNEEMARRLHISPQTLRTHAQRILPKLGVHSRLEAVAFVNRYHLASQLTHMAPPDGPHTREGAPVPPVL